jgi:hypothetical protein
MIGGDAVKIIPASDAITDSKINKINEHKEISADPQNRGSTCMCKDFVGHEYCMYA